MHATTMHAWGGDAQDLRCGGLPQGDQQIVGYGHRFGQITDAALIIGRCRLYTEHAGIRLFGLRTWA
jgi:hypothetical protein